LRNARERKNTPGGFPRGAGEQKERLRRYNQKIKEELKKKHIMLRGVQGGVCRAGKSVDIGEL